MQSVQAPVNETIRLRIYDGDITLLEVYQAVEAPKVFAIHNYAAHKPCLVSCNIKHALEQVLHKTQTSMETSLDKMSLADVIAELKEK